MFQVNGVARKGVQSRRAIGAWRDDNGGEGFVNSSEGGVNNNIELLHLSRLEVGDSEVYEAAANHFADQIRGVDFSADMH